MRAVISFLATLSPIAVFIAGCLAAGMSVYAGDWYRLCLIVIVVSIYLYLIDRDERRY